MFSRHQAGNTDEGLNMFLAPALAMSAWNPFWAATLKGNAQAHEWFDTVAHECQDFVAHRVQEDIALMQRLAHCSTPDQVWSAYFAFWQRAAEDYSKQFSSMTKVMQGATSKMIVAAQSATDEASKQSFSWQRAAA